LEALQRSDQWTVHTAREHLSFEKADPWSDYWTCKQTLAAGLKSLGP
jgi:bifunctional non-homologous end joining protein LigD